MDPVRSWPGFGLVCLSTNLATFRIRHMPSVQCPPLLHPHTIARPSYTPTPLPAPPGPGPAAGTGAGAGAGGLAASSAGARPAPVPAHAPAPVLAPAPVPTWRPARLPQPAQGLGLGFRGFRDLGFTSVSRSDISACTLRYVGFIATALDKPTY